MGGGGVTGVAEPRVAIKLLADCRAEDALIVASARDEANVAVGALFEHELFPLIR